MKRLTVPIKFKKLHPKAVIPEYQTEGAACVDLVATEINYIGQSEDKIEVKFGFATDIPPHYKVILVPRSGFTHKDWVMQNSPAQIDSDYRGEWKCKFQAIPKYIYDQGTENWILGYEAFPYKVGERVVQASVEVKIHMQMVEVKELEETARGDGGFGHTGK